MLRSVPKLFNRLREGDPAALNDLVTALYPELHRIASRHLKREREDHTLQTTALVHEAYLKIFDGEERRFADQVHFLAVASRVMRQVLVDYARARAALKRGGADSSFRAVKLDVEGGRGTDLLDLIALDSALSALAADDESLARLVEMHYFGGMTAEEIAAALDISVHVVRHDLRLGQAWLRRKLNQR